MSNSVLINELGAFGVTAFLIYWTVRLMTDSETPVFIILVMGVIATIALVLYGIFQVDMLDSLLFDKGTKSPYMDLVMNYGVYTVLLFINIGVYLFIIKHKKLSIVLATLIVAAIVFLSVMGGGLI